MRKPSTRLGLIAAGLVLALGVHAQGSAPSALDIAAQPLDRALGALVRQSGARIVFSTALTESRQAPAQRGEFSVEQALERLLAGSGLVARPTGQGGYTVVAPQPEVRAPAADQALATVTVRGDAERETATSPVLGYFARRSSTSTKTDTPIVETPQSVSVVTRMQLDEQRPASLVEALEYAPGVFTGQVGATNRYDYLPLRGFIETSTDNTVLDGLKLLSDGGSYTSMQIDPYMVERIDVYRGPSSVLFGRNAPGGLVALTSKRPSSETQRALELSIGSHQRHQLGVDLTGPLGAADGPWSYRLTAMARENHTEIDHVKEGRYALAPSLQHKPDARTSLLLQAYLQYDPEGGYHGGIPAEGTLSPRGGRRVPTSFFEGDPEYNAFQRQQRMLGYLFEHQFGEGWTLRHNLRYLAASTHLEQVYAYGWSGPTTLTRYTSGADERLHAWTVDNQLQYDTRTGPVGHTLLLGLDHQTRKVTGQWSSGSASDIDVFAPQYGNALVGDRYVAAVDRELRQTGIYLQDQLAWARWRLTLSGRWDNARTTNLAYGTTDMQRWEGSKFSKRAGLVYLAENGLAPYASYSESFNPSGFIGTRGEVLQPTESRQVEAGLKYETAGGIGLASIAAFDLAQDNVATRVLGTPNYAPVGKVRSRGVEAEARLQLNRRLALLASYTYTDAEYVRADSATQGKTPYQVPRHMASLWADHRFGHGVSLGGGVRHVGRSWADTANTVQVPAYTLVDLTLRMELGDWLRDWQGATLRLNVKNLADKRYVASCASLNYCYQGEGRRISATLGYQW